MYHADDARQAIRLFVAQMPTALPSALDVDSLHLPLLPRRSHSLSLYDHSPLHPSLDCSLFLSLADTNLRLALPETSPLRPRLRQAVPPRRLRRLHSINRHRLSLWLAQRNSSMRSRRIVLGNSVRKDLSRFEELRSTRLWTSVLSSFIPGSAESARREQGEEQTSDGFTRGS